VYSKLWSCMITGDHVDRNRHVPMGGSHVGLVTAVVFASPIYTRLGELLILSKSI